MANATQYLLSSMYCTASRRLFALVIFVVFTARVHAESPSAELSDRLPRLTRLREKIAAFSQDKAASLSVHFTERQFYQKRVRRYLETMALYSTVAAHLDEYRLLDPALPPNDEALERAYLEELVELGFMLHRIDRLQELQSSNTEVASRPSDTVLHFLVSEIDADFGVLPGVVARLPDVAQREATVFREHMQKPEASEPRRPSVLLWLGLNFLPPVKNYPRNVSAHQQHMDVAWHLSIRGYSVDLLNQQLRQQISCQMKLVRALTR